MTALPCRLLDAPRVRSKKGSGGTAGRSVSHGARAAGAIRRFAKANGLNYLWTLTYAEAAADRAQVVRDVMRFFAGLAVHLGELAAVAVIERGGQGTKRLHVHFAMQGRVDHKEMEWLWGHGYVYYGDPNRHPGRSTVERLAGYLSKYLTKTFDEGAAGDGDRQAEQNRYLHTQGFEPECTTRRFDLPEYAEDWLALLMEVPGAPRSFQTGGELDLQGRTYRWHPDYWWRGPGP